jgi:SAUR family protein
MKRLLRRLSRTVSVSVAGEDGGPAARPSSRHRRRRRKGKKAVPQGHVPVCVGEEGGPAERFAVRAELLGEPPLAALLRRAAQEYGYAHPGALRIPCPVDDFRRLLLRLSHGPSSPAPDAMPRA